METEEFEALKRDLNEAFSHIEDIGERKKSMVSALKYLRYSDDFKLIKDRDPAYSWERHDCTVRALSAFADIPYAEAHDIAKEAGRQDGEAACIQKVMSAAKKRGIAFFQIRIKRDQPTVIDFSKERSKGRYLLILEDHGLALIDGVLVDDQCDYVLDLVKGYFSIPFDFHFPTYRHMQKGNE